MGAPVTTVPGAARGGLTPWKGSMTVLARGRFRLLICEREVFTDFTSRLVYADTILL